jgi:ABC-type uncharacterized transport system substrate-binding protein
MRTFRHRLLPRLLVAVLAVVLASASGRTRAHPHVWIDLKSQIEFNSDGQVTGLQIHWAFDEFYSAFVIRDSGGTEAIDQEMLTRIGRQNIANLREFGYFTEFLVDGEIQNFAAPKSFEMRLHNGKLRLQFSVPLETPLFPDDHQINYAVFDPSYFIEILHVDGGYRLSPGSGSDGCETTLIKPNPTSEALNFAESLDRMESAPKSFGALFAERVHLECS